MPIFKRTLAVPKANSVRKGRIVWCPQNAILTLSGKLQLGGMWRPPGFDEHWLPNCREDRGAPLEAGIHSYKIVRQNGLSVFIQ